MSKHFLFFVSCLLLAFSLQAQEDMPILLSKSYKKIKYAPAPGAKFAKIEAVKSLDAKGVLKLGGKSTAKLYCNGRFKDIEGKGEYAIADLFAEELRYSAMGFANTFNGMLMAAINGPRGSDTTATSSGWGNKKFDIIGTTPIGKAVAGQSLNFHWQSKKPLPEYEFMIEDESGKVIHSKKVGQKQYTLNFSDLNLQAGKTYAWKVVQPGGEGMASNKYLFTIAAEKEKEEVISALQEEEVYQQADALLKKLMEAASLEEAEFYYDADRSYEEASQMAGDEELPEKMREAFARRRSVE